MKILLRIWLCLLPLQTALIWRTTFITTKWEQATILFLATEFLLLVIAGLYWWKKRPAFSWPGVFMFFYFLVVIFRAPDQWLAFQTVRWIGEAMILYYILQAKILPWPKIIFWFTCGSIFPAVLGIGQFFMQTTWVSSLFGLAAHSSWVAGASVVVTNMGRWLRAYGTFSHPNILGGFMVLTIAQIVWFLKNDESIRRKLNYFYLFALIITTTALALSFSRAAWIAWAVVIILAHCEIFRHSVRPSAFPLAVFVSTLTFIVVIGLLWPVVTTRVTGVGINERESISERVVGFTDAWGVFKNNWLLGVGPGNFTIALQKSNPSLVGWQLQPVHNVWLLFLTEWGLVGVLFLGWLIKIVYKKISRPTALVFFLTLFIILSLFDHYLYTTLIGWVMTMFFISSTFYPHQSVAEPKNSPVYPH